MRMEISNNVDISNIYEIYENISKFYSKSIKTHPQYEKMIKKCYTNVIQNFAKTILSMYHIQYLDMFEMIVNHSAPDDEEILEFSDNIVDYINSYFNELNLTLNIKTPDDLNQLKVILKLSSIFMDQVYSNQDLISAYEVFFQIEKWIDAKNLSKKTMTIINNEEYEIKMVFDENSISKKKEKTRYFNLSYKNEYM